jgi:hypothetical protein
MFNDNLVMVYTHAILSCVPADILLRLETPSKIRGNSAAGCVWLIVTLNRPVVAPGLSFAYLARRCTNR